MGLIDKLFALLASQIKQPNAKLLKTVVKAQTIQDNDQSITLGAINEKNSKPILRSASKTGSVRRRSKQSKRED